MRLLLLAASLMFFSDPASAVDVKSTTFDVSFNRQLSRSDSSYRLTRVRCGGSRGFTCEYRGSDGLNVIASGSDNAAEIDSVAARLSRDTSDQAQRRRATLAALIFLGAAMNTLSVGRPQSERTAAQKQILDEALTDAARGEARVGQFKYVLSFTQADNIRIYIEPAAR